MDIDLQARLFHSHPNFFRKLRRPAATGAGPIHYWGIECGNGWFRLIDTLAGCYEELIRSLIVEGVPKRSWPRPSQIKEKFGRLKFHIQNLKHVPPNLIAATEKTEAASALICETCGAPGTLRTDGYWRAICDSCAKASPKDNTFDAELHLQQLKILLASRSP